MPTTFVTGISNIQDSYSAGQAAAKMAVAKGGGEKVDLILLFAGVNHHLNQVKEGVLSVTNKALLIGCTSAGEFNEDEVITDGVVCALISSDTHKFFTGMGTHVTYNEAQAIHDATKDFPAYVEGYPYRSAMIFLDGLIGKGEEVVLTSHSILGADVKFAGAAAADNLKFKETLVFCGDRILPNAVAMCLLASKHPVVITVKHGHKPLSPALTVTKAKDNILYEIAGEPAFEVWKRYVRDDLKKDGYDIDQISDPEEISKLLVKYEAGFMTGVDYKVRFPSSCNKDGSINFSCSIFEGTALKIMSSTEEDQIQSARIAAERAALAANGKKIAGAVIFDCACRETILKEKFSLAVNEMRKVFKGIPLIGFETYGEIAMEIGQLSGFHNTTTVIMLILD
ncbi:MAG: hypothetical protein BGO14_10660 [Chlamydiales bacterium 38-26]|nr:FIST C-terminal domain-containing protein [Chlamydiales bacterium]OJV11415.1 MAG: hypothetical protein BGO14_10660 [Chlamydiales bacterium 38-26]